MSGFDDKTDAEKVCVDIKVLQLIEAYNMTNATHTNPQGYKKLYLIN